ncbi:MAG TPA: hypothetical protein VGC54_04690 [Planctomycetota bacterium]
MKTILAILAAAALAVPVAAQDATVAPTAKQAVQAAPVVLTAQTACPVGGKPIDKTKFVDYEGQRVYFCCDKCPVAFKQFPDKYLFAMYKAGVQPENTQTTCVVSGEKLENRDHFAQVLNKRVYTCCDKCLAKVKAEPAKYFDKLEGRKAQSVCPLTGEPIDGEAFATIQGQKVGFCCAGCESKMAAAPQKYFDAIAAKGMVTAPALSTCPVSGEPIKSQSYFATWNGHRVNFCCEDCIGAFVKKPEKWTVSL